MPARTQVSSSPLDNAVNATRTATSEPTTAMRRRRVLNQLMIEQPLLGWANLRLWELYRRYPGQSAGTAAGSMVCVS